MEQDCQNNYYSRNYLLKINMIYSNIKYQGFCSKRRFGIELEMGNAVSKNKIRTALEKLTSRQIVVSNYMASIKNQYWHIKNDATCGPVGKSRVGPKGIEVASYIGSGIEDIKHIADVAQQLSIIGCEVNDNCGLHIHAEAVDLSTRHVGTILAYWMKIEKCLEQAMPQRRRDNIFCKTLTSDFVMPYSSISFLRNSPENFYLLTSPETRDLSARRVTLNIANYVKACLYKNQVRKTLELRWPEGSLDPLDIKCWAKLFLNFIENCKNRKMPDDIQYCSLNELLIYFGISHENEFFILDEDLYEAKIWLLERFVRYSDTHAIEALKILKLIQNLNSD